MDNPEYRLLTLADLEPAAQVIVQAFVDDPLVSFMLPKKSRRVRTLTKFFRVYGEININNKRVSGVGEPLQGVAVWKFPTEDSLSIRVKSLGKLLPLFFTPYLIGYLRAKAILNPLDALHKKYASEPHFIWITLEFSLQPVAKGLPPS